MEEHEHRFRSKAAEGWSKFFSEHEIVWFYELNEFELEGLPELNGFWLPEIRTIAVVKGMLDSVDMNVLHALAQKASKNGVAVILAEVPVGKFYRLVTNGELTNQITFDCCPDCGRWRFIPKAQSMTCPACGFQKELSDAYRLDGGSRTPASFHDWSSRLDVALAFLTIGGVRNVRLGQPFLCPLPGHEERHPSAAIWRMPDGAIRFCDFHRRSGRKWFVLSEVYASFKIGKVVTLKKGERAAWFLRGLVETGFLELPKLEFPELPVDARPIVRDVYEGFKLRMALGRLYDPDQDFTQPYSWRFAAKWCGWSERHTGTAITWLAENGYLQVVREGKPGKRTATYYNLVPTVCGSQVEKQ